MASFQKLPAELKIMIIRELAAQTREASKPNFWADRSTGFQVAESYDLEEVGRYMGRGVNVNDLGNLAQVDRTMNALVKDYIPKLVEAELKTPQRECFFIRARSLDNVERVFAHLNPIARTRITRLRCKWMNPVLMRNDQPDLLHPHAEFFQVVARDCARLDYFTVELDITEWAIPTISGRIDLALPNVRDIEGFSSFLDLASTMRARTQGYCSMYANVGRDWCSELDEMVREARQQHTESSIQG